MNKKIIMFIILFLSIFTFKLDVFAKCGKPGSLVNPFKWCENQSEDGYVCEYNSSDNTCVKSDVRFCSTLNDNDCKNNRSCKWTGSECIDDYVAETPCNDENILTALRFVGYLLFIAKIAIPLIIIVVATFDLFKSVVDKDEKSLGKQVKLIIMRIVGGIFVFFLPTIVYALFDLSADLEIVNDTKYENCVTCVLKPTQCSITNSSNN